MGVFNLLYLKGNFAKKVSRKYQVLGGALDKG